MTIERSGHAMSGEGRLSKAMRWLLAGACFVVIIAGARAAEPLLVPLLLAVMLAIICVPPMQWLKDHGVPGWLAIVLVVLFVLAVGSAFGTVIGTSLIDFSASLPYYQARLQTELAGLVAWLAAHGIELSNRVLQETLNPGQVLRVAGRIFSGVGDVVSRIGLILLLTVFILFEWSTIRGKVIIAFPDSAEQHLRQLSRVSENVKRYLALKTVLSLATGSLVALLLTVLGVDYALLWGLLAFLLNYVPTIGSIIAAVPGVILAFLQLGWDGALIATIGYLVINVTISNLIEPRVLGQGVGLSALVVFLSLLFWGWVLGPIGMLLSVPLTMIFKIFLEGIEETRWIAILMGPRVTPDAEILSAPEAVQA
ncbi:MAG: AI-2E family transporter [marine benthic group bacterium]|nr:AI-2E family transporter [Gemmatimonadota bacterium]